MAKLSQVLRDKKRKALIKKYATKRADLRAKINDPEVSPDDKVALVAAMARLPRNSCSARLTRRCELTGRSKAVYRKFGLCRVTLRELALKGELPGVVKASW